MFSTSMLVTFHPRLLYSVLLMSPMITVKIPECLPVRSVRPSFHPSHCQSTHTSKGHPNQLNDWKMLCALSGHPISNTDEPVVVTPSGHVCLKRLLLQALVDNGGNDPFESQDHPLSEDDLIELKSQPQAVAIPPPRTSSFTALLNQAREEYDAVLLELFETRKALQETREELSQALYQNDAATRVIARLTTSQQQGPPAVSSKKRRLEDEVKEDDENHRPDTPENKIEDKDLQVLVSTWEGLHSSRKSKQKASAVAAAPLAEGIPRFQLTAAPALAAPAVNVTTVENSKLVMLCKDKTVVVYDSLQKSVESSFPVNGKSVTAIDSNEEYILLGMSNGQVQLYSRSGQEIAFAQVKQLAIVHVALHPSKQHCLVASASGRISLLRVPNLRICSVLKPVHESKATTAALHPDGLIYLLGTAFGEVLLWDLKSQLLASTLKCEQTPDAVVDTAVSSNGYTVAVAHASGLVRMWDLRKQSVVATVELDSALAVQFDDSGKYLAAGGIGGIHLATGKEWKVVSTIQAKRVSGVVWLPGANGVVACNSEQAKLGFFGIKDGN